MRRRFLVLIPSILVLNTILVWTLQHTDIVAFATVFMASIVIVAAELLLTRRTLAAQKSLDAIRSIRSESR